MEIPKPDTFSADLIRLADRFRYEHGGVAPSWVRDSEGDWILGDEGVGPIFYEGVNDPSGNLWYVEGLHEAADAAAALALCLAIEGPVAAPAADSTAADLADMAAGVEGGTDTTVDLPPEVADETRVQNYVVIVERDCTKEQIAAARQQHREWMREHGQGDPMAAAGLRLRELHAAGKGAVMPIALIVASAASVRDEGRANPGDVPTITAPRGDTGTGKGKKRRGGAASAKGPKKSKRSTSFVKRLGASATCYRAGATVDDVRLLELLRASGFSRRPEEIMSAPEYGFCPIDDPAGSTSDLETLPRVGADPEYVVWGLRRDAKTGCPTHRFRYEAEREATQEALAAGKTNANGARIKELAEGKVTAWYRTATPQTVVVPVVYHRPSRTFSVHSNAGPDVAAALQRIQSTIGSVTRIAEVLDACPKELDRTDLRSAEGTGTGSADAAADLLLWIVGRQLGGTGVLVVNDAKLEYWLDDKVDLVRSTADEKKLNVRLGGAPAEGGSLTAALADGATLKSARLALRYNEQEWKVTLAGGVGRAWSLPALTKPDGTPEGLDAAVDERLRLWTRGRELFDHLVVRFVEERSDRGTWRQRISALRTLLGVEMVKRWGWDAERKQGFLFADMMPGRQGTLADVKVEDKREGGDKPKGSRGGKARAKAAETTAEAK